MISDKIEFIEAFKTRTKKFVVDNIRFYQTLPKTEDAKIIGRQLLRSSSSVGANYRAACRGRSKAEFYSKICIVVEEADESVFWMEVLMEANIVSQSQIATLYNEAKEILQVVSRAKKSTAAIK